MSYIYYNPNPLNLLVGDCVIRAISKVTGLSWKETYLHLMIQGYSMCDMPSSNRVWGQLLSNFGYIKKLIPNTCPTCYTIKDFCIDHPYGSYVLGTDSHAVAVINGDYYDSWDSGNEIPTYYFERIINELQ